MAPRVVLEITERASLDEVKDAPERIAALRAMGFRIAIDDLGAGYAGLTSLVQLEPELMKLDMSLVRDVHLSTLKQRLVRSMASLQGHGDPGRRGGHRDEGASSRFLEEFGCDLLQGYLLAKPGRPFPEIAG